MSVIPACCIQSTQEPAVGAVAAITGSGVGTGVGSTETATSCSGGAWRVLATYQGASTGFSWGVGLTAWTGREMEATSNGTTNQTLISLLLIMLTHYERHHNILLTVMLVDKKTT